MRAQGKLPPAEPAGGRREHERRGHRDDPDGHLAAAAPVGCWRDERGQPAGGAELTELMGRSPSRMPRRRSSRSRRHMDQHRHAARRRPRRLDGVGNRRTEGSAMAEASPGRPARGERRGPARARGHGVRAPAARGGFVVLAAVGAARAPRRGDHRRWWPSAAITELDELDVLPRHASTGAPELYSAVLPGR